MCFCLNNLFQLLWNKNCVILWTLQGCFSWTPFLIHFVYWLIFCFWYDTLAAIKEYDSLCFPFTWILSWSFWHSYSRKTMWIIYDLKLCNVWQSEMYNIYYKDNGIKNILDTHYVELTSPLLSDELFFKIL